MTFPLDPNQPRKGTFPLASVPARIAAALGGRSANKDRLVDQAGYDQLVAMWDDDSDTPLPEWPSR